MFYTEKVVGWVEKGRNGCVSGLVCDRREGCVYVVRVMDVGAVDCGVSLLEVGGRRDGLR